VRGIAGETFLDGETRIVHFKRDGTADNNSYHAFSKGIPDYRSLICAAISNDTERRSLGVLCLYSKSLKTFDGEGVKTLVESLAYRFAVVLLSFSR
jgi:hypothetical protein